MRKTLECMAIVAAFAGAATVGQTIIPGGVPMGKTDTGTEVKRRLEAGGKSGGAAATAAPAAAVAHHAPQATTRPAGHRGLSKEGITKPGPTGDATVLEDAPVYRGMKANGPVVASVKKGEAVRIDYEFKNAEGSWCNVRRNGQETELGYVICKTLRRERPQ